MASAISQRSAVDTVHSSSTLWATPSKVWEIPAKPKPGRKPKKDQPPPEEDPAQDDVKSRRGQNRAAQRAFRERKQTQLADLQARIQQYEQGEIERNVALQKVAKRLKDENEQLRQENDALRTRLSRLENLERKKRNDEIPLTPSDGQPPAKKARVGHGHFDDTLQVPHMGAAFSLPSPTSTASTPDSRDYSPRAQSMSLSSSSRGSSFEPVLDFRSPSASVLPIRAPQPPGITESLRALEQPGPFGTFDCGFCDEHTPCVCRELAMQAAASAPVPLKLEPIERPTSDLLRLSDPSATMRPLSLLDNLDQLPYQAPLPLRRRSNPGRPTKSIFPVSPLAPTPAMERPGCSGDPDNCPACADDTFGRAFCTAINDSVAATAPCTNCPGDCGRASTTAQPSTFVEHTVPTDDAWRQLKAHPNVSFADLRLLADVVARRSKCSGPVVDDVLGTATPDRPLTPAEGEGGPVLLTDPHSQSGRMSLSPARSAPESAEVHCGRQRIREVPYDAVRDAIRYLDGTFPAN